MRTGLAIEGITAAHQAGLVAGNATMHAERGGRYHSTAYRNALRRLEIRQGTGRTGSCFDGAAAESFFATIKAEIGSASWPRQRRRPPRPRELDHRPRRTRAAHRGAHRIQQAFSGTTSREPAQHGRGSVAHGTRRAKIAPWVRR